MKTLKYFLTASAAALIAFIFCYLLGSFANATFYINDWGNDSRTGVSIVGGFIGIVAFAATFTSLIEGLIEL